MTAAVPAEQFHGTPWSSFPGREFRPTLVYTPYTDSITNHISFIKKHKLCQKRDNLYKHVSHNVKQKPVYENNVVYFIDKWNNWKEVSDIVDEIHSLDSQIDDNE